MRNPRFITNRLWSEFPQTTGNNPRSTSLLLYSSILLPLPSATSMLFGLDKLELHSVSGKSLCNYRGVDGGLELWYVEVAVNQLEHLCYDVKLGLLR